MFSLPIYFIFFLGFFSYIYGKNRSKKKISFNKNSGGQPSHYGYYCLIWVTVPSIIFLLLWQVISNHFILIATINSIPPEFIPKDSTLKKLLLMTKGPRNWYNNHEQRSQNNELFSFSRLNISNKNKRLSKSRDIYPEITTINIYIGPPQGGSTITVFRVFISVKIAQHCWVNS